MGFPPDKVRRRDQRGRRGRNDHQLEGPEEGYSAHLEQAGADRHRLDGAASAVHRRGQGVGRLTPEQQATPEQGLPEFHEVTTREAVRLASVLSNSARVPNSEVALLWTREL